MIASVRRWVLRSALPAVRDMAIAAGALWLALELRFDFAVPAEFANKWAWLAPIAAALLVATGAARGIYRTVPEFAGLFELLRLGQAVAFTGVVLLGVSKFLLPDRHVVPLSVCVVATLIMFFALGSVRFGPRLMGHLRSAWDRDGDGKRVLVIGAGKAGEMLVRDMLRTPSSGLAPVGFLDDDPAKRGARIHNVPVLGPTADVAVAAQRVDAELALLAMPSAPSRIVREVLGRIADAGLRAKIVPSLGDLLGAPVTVADVRDVDIADLIGREAVDLDAESIAGFLKDTCVAVTGAAGSIGAELARQLIPFRPKALLLLDNDETDVFDLHNRLRPVAARSDVEVHMLVCSVRDARGVDAAFERHRPDVVFHAAANKHVPVMESHPAEAVLTNVTGTRNVAAAAIAHGAQRFILVSTDKAVRPSGVMGATKRLAELLVATMGAGSGTVFASVRFGNVLGSRG
ncbi:MAG: polysaccharide biosynthesis protein, partial [Actinomycetota bacterium]